MTNPTPYALFIRGPSDRIFALSDTLGFDGEMTALAVSVFEDGPQTMHLQALYDSEVDAQSATAKLDISGLEHFITQLPDEDWVSLSQSGLPPVQAGRFFVYGSHDQDNIPKDAIYPILVNAGMAFGTGHHGTTKGCLLAFERLVSPENGENAPCTITNILDLGTGTGVLAIAAAKALGVVVLATDIDQDAVDVTIDNAKTNQITDHIEAAWSNGMQADVIAGKAPFDLIFANILAGPLIGMAADIAAGVRTGGYAILSGILDEQAEQVLAAFTRQSMRLQSSISDTGWTSLTMIKT